MTTTDAKQYNVVNGTSYHTETPDAVVKVLERLRASGENCRVFYGDTKTGRAWPEEHDVWGHVSRSTGSVKIPLLCHPRSHGAPGMLDHCIVAIVARNSAGKAELVYRHPKLSFGQWALLYDEDLRKWALFLNGETHSRHDSYRAAKILLDFMTGKRIGR